MSGPVHTVVETPAFAGQLDKLQVTETERVVIYDAYAGDPAYGKIVPRTGGLRKGRIGKDDTGKSGGYRVFSFFADESHPVFLLWIIDKTKDANLTRAQEAVFKALTTTLKLECR